MRHVILSVDYEIFGNGSGDVRQHILRPTQEMARICHDHGVPLTVFVEMEEYCSFVEFRGRLKRDLGYDPAQEIADQVAVLAAQGHDFQLHLHPEWVGARFQDGRWQLHREQRTVDDLFATQAETDSYIASRKSLLETLVRKGAPRCSVSTYRAGAFSAQPGKKLLPALAAAGISIDTSVVKGLHGGPANLDYRNAPCSKGPWRVKDDVSKEAIEGAIWEFPIYSLIGRRYHQATLGRLRAKFSKNVPKDKQMEMVSQLGIGRNPLKAIRFLWQPVPIKLDFHNVSPGKLVHWIRSAPPPSPGLPDVVVLIGHTKEHIENSAFENLVAALSRDSSCQISGFDAVARILQRTKEQASLIDNSAGVTA